MSRSAALRIALVASVAAVAVTGCGAGFEPYTSPSMKPRDAVNHPAVGGTSPIAIRHAYVLGPAPDEPAYPKDGNAAVYLTLVNQSSRADRLIDASSPAADDTVIASGSGGSTLDLPPTDPTVTGGDAVQVGQPPYSSNTITLTKLDEETDNGAVVSVTLTFQRAGDITLDLPVNPRTAYRSSLSPAPASGASETPAPGEESPTPGEETSPTGE
ncbi:MAG: copper chaperone PCu(A)C [Streptosporangiales bacterium]|nr:copper chaperone PCu(A)C [Streptosporangiales bacterium]